eukprot:6337644-Alexandrium_andersonii.AAC.1
MGGERGRSSGTGRPRPNGAASQRTRVESAAHPAGAADSDPLPVPSCKGACQPYETTCLLYTSPSPRD